MLKFLKSSKAQSLVEFALILPLFLLLVFGTIELSRIGHSYVTLNNAVRNSVRVASLGGLDSDVQNNIIASAPLLDENLLNIEITPDDSNRHSGSSVLVSATYPVALITPILSQVLTNPVIITSSLTMRVE